MTVRIILGALGGVAFITWLAAIIIQFQQGASTLTLYVLPVVTFILDAAGSVVAIAVALYLRRRIWVLYTLLLNILPLGFAPLVYAIFGLTGDR